MNSNILIFYVNYDIVKALSFTYTEIRKAKRLGGKK